MAKSKGEIQVIILNDLVSIHNRRVELTNRLEENVEDNLAYLRELATQLLQPSSGPFVAKTPKILRKKAVPRIETILENEVFDGENSRSTVSLQSVDMEQEASVLGGRSKRNASKKAADSIKQSFLSIDKVKRELEDENDSTSSKRAKRQTSIKRKKSISSSDEDDTRSSSKYSRVDEDQGKPKKTKRMTKKKSEHVDALLKKIQETEDVRKKSTIKLSKSQRSDRSRSNSSQDGEVNKVDVIIAPNMDNMEEPSMYEDAIEKPTPIMNSTMKHSFEKKLNVTVVLERLPQQTKLNETVVIQKAGNRADSKGRTSAKKTSQDSSMDLKKEMVELNNYNELITEDESSPERKRSKYLGKKKEMKNLSLSSDNEIPNTPMKTRLRGASTVAQEKIKATYKSSALFSPYAKESVKKRVEAFEQAVMHSPKLIDIDTGSRVTRSKTRALNTVPENAEKNVKQILARKSLAKAKRISLAKQVKDTEEFKENKDTTTMPERITKLLDKPSTRQTQQKTTPLSKLRMVQTPLSMNRLQMATPTNGQNALNYPKVLSAQRANIVTGVDSLISKSVSKTNLTNSEKTEDKKPYEEDARKKREDALRLLTEEKRRKRQEKELKNKLAREAKERQDLEKRQKAEREREEKAKLALLIQEKHREEIERKRLAQMQRAQEKEERRKLEEQQRLQKLQEQEEMERLLAEQRRREQEAERRKEAEVRAQQQAAAEALRQRQLMLAAQAKSKPQGPTNYKLESDPDDDSDDENKPKHEIPYWAQPNNRKAQLVMQRHIPRELINKFFDTRKCTPDLTELFQGIDKSRLQRTSSAIWKPPPRTDMMEVDY